jgi:hypothetical protein
VKTGELGEGPERKDGGGHAESWSGDFSVSSDGYLSARAEDDGLSHVEKILQQENTFAEKYSGLQSENGNLDLRDYPKMTIQETGFHFTFLI